MKSKNLLNTVILLLVFSLLLTGCGQKSSPPEASPVTSNPAEKQLTIVTSFYPIYIMTLNVTKDIPGVEVFNLTKPITGCLHDYQLTPDDLIRLQKADIFVVNGAGMESFLDKVILQQPNLKIIEASSGITLLEEDGAVENPHVWVSISGAMQQVQNIGRELAQLDPAHGDRYEVNTAAYVEKLEGLKVKMHQVLDKLENPNIVTFHEAFPYFAEEFDLNIVAVIEREPGSEPSAAELAKTIEIVKTAKVTALFAEPQYPVKAAEVIARETEAKVYILDPVVTGPDDPDAYLNIMAENLTVLQGALN
jgi:zinc transport system substrate-binding protein